MAEKKKYIRKKIDYFDSLVRTFLNSKKKNKFTLSDLKEKKLKTQFRTFCEKKNIDYKRCSKKIFYSKECPKLLKCNDKVSYDPDSKEYEYDEDYLNIDDESDSEEEEEEEEEEIEQEEKEKLHPYPLEWFKENRLAQYECAKKIINESSKKKNVIVTAEEKSGKRIICEIISLLCKKNKLNVKNYFYTALNRTDIHSQLAEQEKYRVKSKIIKSPADAELEIVELTKEMGKNPKTLFLFHFDECDYGSGDTQSLSSLYEFIRNSTITSRILYSATAEEAQYVYQDFTEDWSIIPFTPDESYRGSKWYLENNKVREAKNFLNYDEDTLEVSGFSSQGQKLIKKTKNSGKRNIIICRITKYKKDALTLYRNVKQYYEENKTKLFNKQKIKCHFVDKDTPFDWGDETTVGNFADGYVHIIFICQTCTRSTEIHNALKAKIRFWHDNRYVIVDKKTGSAYNTLSQAFGRIKYYKSDEYDVDIIIYADPLVFELCSGRMNYEDVPNLKLADRMKSKRQLFDPSNFKIKFCNTWDEIKKLNESIRQKLNLRRYTPKFNFKLDEKNKDFYKSWLRGFQRLSRKELEENKGCGLNDKARIRFNIVYKDINDHNTKKFAIRWFEGERNETQVHSTTDKSMYHIKEE